MSRAGIATIDSSSESYGVQILVSPSYEYRYSANRIDLVAAVELSMSQYMSQYIVTQFEDHLREWREAMAFCSNIDDIQRHPSYKAIISLGWGAIPLIIEDMKHGGCFWSKALTSISGEDPVPKNDAGDCAAIAKHWINWYER